jgi:hypothetical protein
MIVHGCIEMHPMDCRGFFEENSNFHVFDNSLVDVDAEELNVVLSSNGQANIDEDDDYDDIHIEDCDGADDYSIDDEEEENFD